jgi:hypothetical protein
MVNLQLDMEGIGGINNPIHLLPPPVSCPFFLRARVKKFQ